LSQAGANSSSGGGGGTDITEIGVDASTPPGTNPVVPNGGGEIFVTGGQVAAGTTTHVIRTDSLAANTFTVEIQRSQAVASSTIGDNGVCHFSSADFTVDANGFVQSKSSALNYTNVVGPTTYTVLATDDYISCDSTAGAIQLNFPNAPAANRIWTVKDRTGTAAVNAITITTPGGAVTIDGATTYTIISNYGAVNLLANATPTYEVY
jgi:hypothetical protein